jgi:hypothetical protein
MPLPILADQKNTSTLPSHHLQGICVGLVQICGNTRGNFRGQRCNGGRRDHSDKESAGILAKHPGQVYDWVVGKRREEPTGDLLALACDLPLRMETISPSTNQVHPLNKPLTLSGRL